MSSRVCAASMSGWWYSFPTGGLRLGAPPKATWWRSSAIDPKVRGKVMTRVVYDMPTVVKEGVTHFAEVRAA